MPWPVPFGPVVPPNRENGSAPPPAQELVRREAVPHQEHQAAQGSPQYRLLQADLKPEPPSAEQGTQEGVDAAAEEREEQAAKLRQAALADELIDEFQRMDRLLALLHECVSAWQALPPAAPAASAATPPPGQPPLSKLPPSGPTPPPAQRGQAADDPIRVPARVTLCLASGKRWKGVLLAVAEKVNFQHQGQIGAHVAYDRQDVEMIMTPAATYVYNADQNRFEKEEVADRTR